MTSFLEGIWGTSLSLFLSCVTVDGHGLLRHKSWVIRARDERISLLLVVLVLGVHATKEQLNKGSKRSARFHREGEAANQHSMVADADDVDVGAFGCLGLSMGMGHREALLSSCCSC